MLGPMFIGRSSAEPGANAPTEALATRLLRWIRPGLTVLVAYPLADNVALVPLDGRSAQSCSDKRQVRGG